MDQPKVDQPKTDEAAAPPADAGKQAEEKPAEVASAPAETTPPAEATPPATAAPKVDEAATPPAPGDTTPAPTQAKVAVEAVEIEGSKVFVAGIGDPGRYVRVYANEIVLGETSFDSAGRFLIEAQRDLPVGQYMTRADLLDSDGVTVIARAVVPFEREEGEAIAAVAPDQPSPPAANPPAEDKPAEVAAADEPPADAGAATQPATPPAALNETPPPADDFRRRRYNPPAANPPAVAANEQPPADNSAAADNPPAANPPAEPEAPAVAAAEPEQPAAPADAGQPKTDQATTPPATTAHADRRGGRASRNHSAEDRGAGGPPGRHAARHRGRLRAAAGDDGAQAGQGSGLGHHPPRRHALAHLAPRSMASARVTRPSTWPTSSRFRIRTGYGPVRSSTCPTRAKKASPPT